MTELANLLTGAAARQAPARRHRRRRTLGIRSDLRAAAGGGPDAATVLVPGGRLASPRGPPMAVPPSEPASSKNSCPPTQRLLTHGVGVIQTSWRAGLSTEFTDVRIERRSLPWHFDSGPALITFLRAHSPAYVIAAQAAGDRAGEMFAAIERTQRPTAARCAKKRSTCWRWRACEWRWR